jgi:Flp pilus assembly protein TadD
VVLHSLGRRPEAIEAYRRALELDPEDARTRLNLGLALLESGRSEEARLEAEALRAFNEEAARHLLERIEAAGGG